MFHDYWTVQLSYHEHRWNNQESIRLCCVENNQTKETIAITAAVSTAWKMSLETAVSVCLKDNFERASHSCITSVTKADV